MILDLIKTAWKPLLIIALVSLTMTWAFNIQNMMISTRNINGVEIMYFNTQTYLLNISNAWDTNALNFEDIIPTRTFSNDSQWSTLANNLACLFDWLYFPINFILWIIRWIAWLVKILLAMIGWNTLKDENGIYYSQLASILNWIIQNLVLPYL